MDKTIYNRVSTDYQLIKMGIELAHSVIAISVCDHTMEGNSHFVRAKELAHKWNNTFIDLYVSSKEGR